MNTVFSNGLGVKRLTTAQHASRAAFGCISLEKQEIFFAENAV
jgi:hypothetical protein